MCSLYIKMTDPRLCSPTQCMALQKCLWEFFFSFLVFWSWLYLEQNLSDAIREEHKVTSLHTFYPAAVPGFLSVLFIYWKWSENRVLRSTELIISKMLLTPILSSAVLIRMEWVHRLHTILGRSIQVPWRSEYLFSVPNLFSNSLTPKEAAIWILMYSFPPSEHSEESQSQGPRTRTSSLNHNHPYISYQPQPREHD